jgi:hypothetical protein
MISEKKKKGLPPERECQNKKKAEDGPPFIRGVRGVFFCLIGIFTSKINFKRRAPSSPD